MPSRIVKNVFNAGELSEYLAGRTDLSKYYNGCSVMVNATALPYGGVVKRPGTEFIARAKEACIVIPFEFSASDNMIIEMGNLYMRFYELASGETSWSRVIMPNATAAFVHLGATTYKWTESPATVGEYYVESAEVGGGNPDIIDPRSVLYGGTDVEGGTEMERGELGSLTEGQYAYGDNDTLEYDTVYVKIADGADPDTLTAGIIVADYIYELTTPFAYADVYDLHFLQSADVIYFTHVDYHPQKLSRLANNSWTIADIDFEGGPFLVQNTSAVTMEYASTDFERTGTDYYFPVDDTGTLTASVATFQGSAALDVGTKWRIKHTRADNVISTEDNSTNSKPTDNDNAVLTKGDFTFSIRKFNTDEIVKLWRKEGDGEYQQYRDFSTETAFSATEDIDEVYYAWTRSESGTTTGTFIAKQQTNYGIVEVAGNSGNSTITVQVKVLSPVGGEANSGTSAAPTAMWAEGSWGEYRGFPDTLTFYEDRLWFAGSAYQPQTLWASKSSEYENFTSGDLDNESLSYTINDSDVSNIEWLAADEVLLCGTSKKEYKVSANSADDPITPSDIKVRPQSSHGSLGIQPIMLNNALFFAQGQGKKMRAMRFTDSLNRFKSDDATLLANHMLENLPVQLAAQRIPDSIIWCVREDGVLCSFTYEPDEEVAAWARHLTGYPQSSSALKGNAPPVHLFKSVAATRGDEEDTVTCVVKRGDNYNIEQFSTRFFDEPDEALMLDSAIVSESGTDAINITYASDTVRYGAGEYGSGIYGV